MCVCVCARGSNFLSLLPGSVHLALVARQHHPVQPHCWVLAAASLGNSVGFEGFFFLLFFFSPFAKVFFPARYLAISSWAAAGVPPHTPLWISDAEAQSSFVNSAVITQSKQLRRGQSKTKLQKDFSWVRENSPRFLFVFESHRFKGKTFNVFQTADELVTREKLANVKK